MGQQGETVSSSPRNVNTCEFESRLFNCPVRPPGNYYENRRSTRLGRDWEGLSVGQGPPPAAVIPRERPRLSFRGRAPVSVIPRERARLSFRGRAPVSVIPREHPRLSFRGRAPVSVIPLERPHLSFRGSAATRNPKRIAASPIFIALMRPPRGQGDYECTLPCHCQFSSRYFRGSDRTTLLGMAQSIASRPSTL